MEENKLKGNLTENVQNFYCMSKLLKHFWMTLKWSIRNSWFTRKDPDAEKDWRQEEKGMTEDEMVGWHHRLNGHEFEQALGDGDGQGRLECCSPWSHKAKNNNMSFLAHNIANF